jgi:hypothetical protein
MAGAAGEEEQRRDRRQRTPCQARLPGLRGTFVLLRLSQKINREGAKDAKLREEKNKV